LNAQLTSVHDSTQSTLIQLEARSDHLDQLQHIGKTSSPAFDEWCRTRLDRMLVDWMLRKGYGESARTLAKSRRIEVGMMTKEKAVNKKD
jgi:macrophage erythroblast attacher